MKITVSAIVCAVLATAFADQVAAASLSGGYSIGALGSGCSAEGQQGSGSLTESSSGCSSYLTSGSFLVSGSGVATYDTLRATAGVGFSNVDPDPSATSLGNAQGGARYDDWITIDIPGRTGDDVDLVFTAAMHGSMSASADSYSYGQANASLNVYVKDGYVLVSRNAKSAGVPADNDYNPGLAHITVGTPFAVSAELKLSAYLDSTVAHDTYTGNVSAAFANSAGITSFELFETGSETPITDWDLTSQSGEFGFYSVVPLPASGWLFMSGLIALGARLRRQRAPETLC